MEDKTENKNETAEENPIQLEKIIQIDSLQKNSVVVFRLKEVTKNLLMAMRSFSERYGETLREKNVSVIVCGLNDKIEELKEDQMERCGWIRKNPSRIITLS